VSATLLLFAVVAGVSYLIRADISRAYAFVSLPLGLALLVAGRFAWRATLPPHFHRRRQRRGPQRVAAAAPHRPCGRRRPPCGAPRPPR
jgi:hypothetical protein